jgi:hypothetical protein
MHAHGLVHRKKQQREQEEEEEHQQQLDDGGESDGGDGDNGEGRGVRRAVLAVSPVLKSQRPPSRLSPPSSRKRKQLLQDGSGDGGSGEEELDEEAEEEKVSLKYTTLQSLGWKHCSGGGEDKDDHEDEEDDRDEMIMTERGVGGGVLPSMAFILLFAASVNVTILTQLSAPLSLFLPSFVHHHHHQTFTTGCIFGPA